MEKNLRLIVIDELGDSYCFEAFRVPEAETLKQARFDAELARYIEECDGDEEEAYLMLCDDIDNAMRGW